VDGIVCEHCCSPFDEPGQHGNPPCVEGATCCSTGEWQCNGATGQSTCALDGDACQPACCDPFEEPGLHGNPTCIEGATCCASGKWQCNGAAGQSTCEGDGTVCEPCCDPLQEPPCIEGATCCSDGAWACNDGAGNSTCVLDGDACKPPCCDPADQPNAQSEPYCETGFTCCADGTWKCNDPEGATTCPVAQAGDVCPQVCGGIAGIPCEDPGEFCKLPAGECCCDAFGTCTEVPEACPESYDPVCGCDGVTYGNECFADAAKVSVDHAGPCGICGGIAGIPCDDGEFCRFEPGQCCCDFFGTCEPIPEECPGVCDPVCGCDGTTYKNECAAHKAGVSLEHEGACAEGGGLIAGVGFSSRVKMFWQPHPSALFYSVYRAKVTSPPPVNAGHCYATRLTQPEVAVPGDPDPAVTWNFQVTGHFADGEGPMGLGPNCEPRAPVAPCDPGEQFLCEITGGTWDPLSCGHYPCGQFPPCDAIIPGCNCGPGRNFKEAVGCVPDPTCAE
jgi:hypothetical protein